MQRIEEPSQEVQRISRLGDLEPVATPARTLLQQLVRADLTLERLGVPDFATEHRESFHELRCTGGGDEGVEDEVVAEGNDVDEGMEDRVGVAVRFDVVESNEAGVVRRVGEGE